MIAHLDLDAFFAAVELHRRPELRGRPLVVGGNPDSRGVVATASYAARAYGIRSAMSCAEARRRCPDVVFVPPDIATYREWSRRVWDLVSEMAAPVEQIGIDEGYIGLGDEGAARAREIKQAIRDQVRLSCSLGVATCKVVAKIASDMDKPGGVTVVSAGTERAFLSPLPVRLLPGVGPRTEERLGGAGVRTIGQLAALTDLELRSSVPGQHGLELRERARGIDPRPVSAEPAERISVSYETTFDRDEADRAVLVEHLSRWASALADRLARDEQAARTITVKVRFPDFRTVTRSRTLPAPTADVDTILGVGVDLLERARGAGGVRIRLLGLGIAGLVAGAQLAMFPHFECLAPLYEFDEAV